MYQLIRKLSVLTVVSLVLTLVAPAFAQDVSSTEVQVKLIPSDALLFATWTKCPEVSSTSVSPFYRMLANPEVKQFFAQFITYFKEASEMPPPLAATVGQIAKSEGTLYVSYNGTLFGAQGPPPNPSNIRFCFIAKVAGDAAAFKKTLDAMVQSIKAPVKVTPGTGNYTIEAPGSPPVQIGMLGSYFVVTGGEGEWNKVLANARTAAPAKVTELITRVKRPEGVVFLSHVNLEKLVPPKETIEAMLPLLLMPMLSSPSKAAPGGFGPAGSVPEGFGPPPTAPSKEGASDDPFAGPVIPEVTPTYYVQSEFAPSGGMPSGMPGGMPGGMPSGMPGGMPAGPGLGGLINPAMMKAVSGLLTQTGLFNLQGGTLAIGPDKLGLESKTLIDTAGQLPSILDAVLQKTPLTRAELVIVPKDVTSAFVTRMDLNKLVTEILNEGIKTAKGFVPEAEVQKNMAKVQPIIGMVNAMLVNFGDHLAVYSTSGEAGPEAGPDVTLVVAIKNPAVIPTFNTLISFTGLMPKEAKFGEVSGWSAGPVVWTATAKYLVLSTSQKQLLAQLAHLNNPASPNIMQMPEVVRLFSTANKPFAFGYSSGAETKKNLLTAISQMGDAFENELLAKPFNEMLMGMKRPGAEVQAPLPQLPKMATLINYTEDETMSIARTPKGVEVIKRGLGYPSLMNIGVGWLSQVGPNAEAAPAKMPAGGAIPSGAPSQPADPFGSSL